MLSEGVDVSFGLLEGDSDVLELSVDSGLRLLPEGLDFILKCYFDIIIDILY